MAFTRKTWIWIIVAVLGFCVLCVVALAGFGMYFISHHYTTEKATSAEANRAFEDARTQVQDDRPFYEIDDREHPRQLRDVAAMPASATEVDNVWILVFDSDKGQLIRLSIPFWLIRWGRQKIDIGSGAFDFQQLQLDMRQLQRVGPVVLLDHRPQNGDRVFVWTK